MKTLTSTGSSIRQYPSPCLLFDRQKITCAADVLKSLTHKYNCRFLMAAKALRSKTVYQILNHRLNGFDVSNFNEYNILPDVLDKKTIWFTNPILDSISFNDLTRKFNDLIVSIETLTQGLMIIKQNRRVCLALRLSTRPLEKNNKQARHSRFGILPDEIKNFGTLKQSILGLHIHKGTFDGSEINTVHDYLKMAEYALEITKTHKIKMKILNLGGGLHHLARQDLDTLLYKLRLMINPQTLIYFEPGQYFFKDAGFAAGQVMSIKKQREIIVTLNLSGSCHLKWSQPRYCSLAINKGKKTARVVFCGPTCYESDRLGEFAIPLTDVHKLKTGSVVMFSNISGYSASWNSGFNGILPAKLLFQKTMRSLHHM
ncbi:MAG: hypothetical protein HQM16_10795 [Deltaproteobacteria bacterium]|nr:hypothetical protein [Deltaproteobacteria bacterium]